MSALDDIKARLPDYAKDLKLNLGRCSGRTRAHRRSSGRVAARPIASRNAELREALLADAAASTSRPRRSRRQGRCGDHGDEQRLLPLRHLVRTPEYKTMPARLRMQVIANPASTGSTSSSGRWPYRRSTAAALASTRMSARSRRRAPARKPSRLSSASRASSMPSRSPSRAPREAKAAA